MADDDLAEMKRCEALAEQVYSDMYETRFPAGYLSELKDHFAAAIAAAERAGRSDEAGRLRRRLAHCTEVYRKHFSTY